MSDKLEVLKAMQVFGEKTAKINIIVERLLVQIRKGLERQFLNAKYKGPSPSTFNMLDAMDHTLTHITLCTTLILPLISRAIEKLGSINQTIIAHSEIWDAIVDRGAVETDSWVFFNQVAPKNNADEKTLGRQDIGGLFGRVLVCGG